jgi:DNA invertase Pin-like site-specific DNA recombinase
MSDPRNPEAQPDESIPSVACYLRVSTADQSMDRQLSNTTDFALANWREIDRGDLSYFRDHSTGTNTEREGYKRLMQRAEEGALDAVVVHSVSRVCRSIRDLERTADRLAGDGVSLHIVSEGLSLLPGDEDPYNRAMFRLLGVFAELEAAITRQRVREGIAARQANEDYHHGPAPLGFAKDDGRLIEAENYHRVVEVLDQVAKDEMSKRQAAKELDTSRPTINRSLERGELYAL